MIARVKETSSSAAEDNEEEEDSSDEEFMREDSEELLREKGSASSSFPKILLADPSGHLQSHGINPSQAKQIEDAFKAFENAICNSAAYQGSKDELEQSDSVIVVGDKSGRLNRHRVSVSQVELLEDAFKTLDDEIQKFRKSSSSTAGISSSRSNQLPPTPHQQSPLRLTQDNHKEFPSSIVTSPVLLEDQTDESHVNPMIMLADRSGHLHRHYLTEGQAQQIDDAFKSFQTEILKQCPHVAEQGPPPPPQIPVLGHARKQRSSSFHFPSTTTKQIVFPPRRFSLGSNNDPPGELIPFKLIDYSTTKATVNARNSNPCLTREELKRINAAGSLPPSVELDNRSVHSQQSAPQADTTTGKSSLFPFQRRSFQQKKRRNSFQDTTQSRNQWTTETSTTTRTAEVRAVPPIQLIDCAAKQQAVATTDKKPFSSSSLDDNYRLNTHSSPALPGQRPLLRRNFSDSHRPTLSSNNVKTPMIDPRLHNSLSVLDHPVAGGEVSPTAVRFQVRRKSMTTRPDHHINSNDASYNRLQHNIQPSSRRGRSRSSSRRRGRIESPRQRNTSSLDVLRNNAPITIQQPRRRSHSLRSHRQHSVIESPGAVRPPYWVTVPSTPTAQNHPGTTLPPRSRPVYTKSTSCKSLDINAGGGSDFRNSEQRRSSRSRSQRCRRSKLMIESQSVSAHNLMVNNSSNNPDNSTPGRRRAASRSRSQTRRSTIMMENASEGSWHNLMNNSKNNNMDDSSSALHHFITGSRIRRHSMMP